MTACTAVLTAVLEVVWSVTEPLVDAAAFAVLKERDLQIGPGMMGENITIKGVAVMQLAIGTRLSIGEALVEITEVRIPCNQLNGIATGLCGLEPRAGRWTAGLPE